MELNELVGILGNWSAGKGPTYRRLAQAFSRAIEQGELAAETALPAERNLAAALAVSRSTVVAAYELLREEGWVASRQGSRTRVLPQPASRLTGLRREDTRSRLQSILSQRQAVIDLTVGAPGSLPEFAAPAFNISAADSVRLLGERGYAAAGWPVLRQAVAAYYSQNGLPTGENQILITNGAQQAISLLAQAYLQRGEAVIVESPTYFGAIDAFRATGARLVASRAEPDGLNPALLRSQLSAGLPRLVYLQPNFQNPTGAVLSESARRRLVEISAEFDVPIVEDNTLGELGLEATPPPLLAVYARDSRATVLTIGSLSKLFWAGLRVGWLRGPEPIINRLARLRVVNDLGSSFINQLIASRLIAETAQIKAARREELLPRRAVLESQLAAFLPDWEWRQPAGGLFLWLKLPGGDSASFAQLAQRFGVAVVAGNAMSVDESHSNYLRLPFLPDEATLTEGVRRLSQAWEAYQPFLHFNLEQPKILV